MLVVDARLEHAEGLQRRLGEFDLETHRAKSAKDARALLSDLDLDLVIASNALPEHDGLQLLRDVAALKVPVLRVLLVQFSPRLYSRELDDGVINAAVVDHSAAATIRSLLCDASTSPDSGATEYCYRAEAR